MRMRLPRWGAEMTICRSGSKNATFPPMTRIHVKPNRMRVSLVNRWITSRLLTDQLYRITPR